MRLRSRSFDPREQRSPNLRITLPAYVIELKLCKFQIRQIDA